MANAPGNHSIGVPAEASYLQHLRNFSRNARLFLGANGLSQVSMSIFGVVFYLYLNALGYSLTTIGLLATVETLGTALTAIPAGMFSDRLGRKKSLVIAVTASIFTTLGQAFLTRSVSALLVLGFLRGAATTFKSTLSSPFLMESSSARERIHLFSVNHSLNSVSATAGAALAGVLPVTLIALFGWRAPADARSLQYTLAASVLLYAVSLVPISLIADSPRRPPGGNPVRDLAATWRSGVVRKLVVYNGLIGFGAGLVLSLFTLFLRKRFDASVEQVSVVMTGSRLILGTATLLSPLLVRKLGRIRSVAATQLCSIPLLLVIAFAPTFWAAAVAFWLRNALMNVAGPISNSFTMEIVDPNARATTNGLTTLTSNLARAAAVSVAGYVMDHYSLALPYFGTCIFYTTGSLFWYYSFRHHDPPRRVKAVPVGALVPVSPRDTAGA
jgi:MFS family permease